MSDQSQHNNTNLLDKDNITNTNEPTNTASSINNGNNSAVVRPKSAAPKRAHPKQGPHPKTKIQVPSTSATTSTPVATIANNNNLETPESVSHPNGPVNKKKYKKKLKAPIEAGEDTMNNAPQSKPKSTTDQAAGGKGALTSNPSKSNQISEREPSADLFFQSGFQLQSLAKDDNTMQQVIAQGLAVPSALQPVVNQIQLSGFYRLNIPDPKLASEFASGKLWFSEYQGKITTSIQAKDGLKGSANLIQAGSKVGTAVSSVFTALSIVTMLYYQKVLSDSLSKIQQQLQAIINHLEIKSFARLNVCKTKLWELTEDFYEIVNSSSNAKTKEIEQRGFIDELNRVDQICKELAEETKLAMQMKRKELDDLNSQKKKIDEKTFATCGPIIEQSFYAHKLKSIARILILQKDKQLGLATACLNERRFKASLNEVHEILAFTEHVKQLAHTEEKSRNLITKIFDVVHSHVNSKEHTSPYEQFKEQFSAVGEQLTSTAESYLIYMDVAQKSAKILPELKG